MLYIEESSYERKIDLIEIIAKMENCELVVWLYPESEIDVLMGFALQKSNLVDAESCTAYKAQFMVKCTCRLPINSELIDKLRKHKKEVEQNCDSVCLYPIGNRNWLACVVGHENMALVNSPDFLGNLSKLGFNTSLTPPDWW